jgi:class 3 adenylate cyclase
MTIRHPEHKWSEFAVMLGVFVAGACLTAMTLIAPEHHAGVLLLVFAAYTLLGLRCVHASGAAMAVTVLYAVSAVVDGRTPWPVTATNMLFLLGCNVIGAFVCYVLEQAARREFRHGRALSEERQRSENLLCNVLPTPVAQRLKSHSGAIADAHPDVTILFADIVDFTAYAAAVAPARLVHLLDDIFTRFDALAQKHGLEKIKTIGDAYMVAGGLSIHGFDHVRAIADLALEMLDSIRSVDAGDGRTLALRIGINTGPVVAGVIGKTKFAYDLWGDTVNVASRLESFAQPGTIQVSQSTYDRLRDYYAFSPRHHIRVKGRGELPCYLLLSRTATADLGAAKAVSTRASPVLDAVSSGSCAVD